MTINRITGFAALTTHGESDELIAQWNAPTGATAAEPPKAEPKRTKAKANGWQLELF